MIPVGRFAPRCSMIAHVVKNFAIRNRMITILCKPSGKRYRLRTILAGISREIHKTIGIVRIYACQEAGTGSATHRNIAICVLKQDSARCQTIHIRSLDRLHSVTTQFGTHIVSHQKKNIHSGNIGDIALRLHSRGHTASCPAKKGIFYRNSVLHFIV